MRVGDIQQLCHARIGLGARHAQARADPPGAEDREAGAVLPADRMLGRHLIVAHDDLIEVAAVQEARSENLRLVGDVTPGRAGKRFDAAGGGSSCLLGTEHIEDHLEALTELLHRRCDVGGQHCGAVPCESENLRRGVGQLQLGQRGGSLADQRVAGGQDGRVAALEIERELPAIRQLQRPDQHDGVD